MTGIEFLKTLTQPEQQVIVMASKKEFAIDAYDHEVCDFILRPVEPSRFLQAVLKAKKHFI